MPDALHHQQGGWSDIHSVSVRACARALASDAALLPFRVRLSMLASGAVRDVAQHLTARSAPAGTSRRNTRPCPSTNACGWPLPSTACTQLLATSHRYHASGCAPACRSRTAPNAHPLVPHLAPSNGMRIPRLTCGRRRARRLASKRSRRTHSDSNATRRPRHIFSKVLHIAPFLQQLY